MLTYRDHARPLIGMPAAQTSMLIGIITDLLLIGLTPSR
nr:hypothetical protein Q903MT_gene2874 [Picea sitchensis]